MCSLRRSCNLRHYMGVLDFLKTQVLEVIEWVDDSRDTLSFRFPDDDKAIKRGAQLIVRGNRKYLEGNLGAAWIFADRG